MGEILECRFDQLELFGFDGVDGRGVVCAFEERRTTDFVGTDLV